MESTTTPTSSPLAPADHSAFQDVDIEAPSKPVFGLLREGYAIHTGTGRGARLIKGPARIPLSDKRMARDYLHMLDNRVEVQKAFGLPVDKEMANEAERAELEKITRGKERRRLMGLDGAMHGSEGNGGGPSAAVLEAIIEVKVSQVLAKIEKSLNERIDGLTALINETLSK